MSITVRCPSHGGILTVADNLAGKKIKCPKCAAIFAVDETGVSAGAPAAVPKAPPKEPPPEPAGITPEVAPPLEAEEVPLRPAHIRRDIRQDPATEAVATLIPYRNARALLSYYLGVFSLIPCVGLVLGPIALILGVSGLRYVKANPGAHGTGHAIIGIILGALTSLGNWAFAIAVLVGGGLAIFGKSSPSPGSPGGGPPLTPLFAGDHTLAADNRPMPAAEPGRRAAVRVSASLDGMALSPDGKTLAAVGSTEVKLLDVAGAFSAGVSGRWRGLAFSPDSKQIALARMANPVTIDILDVADQSVLRRLPLGQGPHNLSRVAIVYAPDGSWLAAAAATSFKVWDTETWQERPHSYRGQAIWGVPSLAAAPDRQTLAVAAHDGVLLWDVAGMKEKGLVKQPQGALAVAFSPDGATLAFAAPDGHTRLWDVAQGKEIRSLNGNRERIRVLCFSPDGKYLAEKGSMSDLLLWDVPSGQELARRTGPKQGNGAVGLAFTPDGTLLLTTEAPQGLIKAWDVAALAGGVG